MLMKMPRLLAWMQAKNIGVYNGVTFQGVTSKKGIKIITKEGETKTIEADTVMVVNKYRKNSKLYEALQGNVPERYLIGARRSPRQSVS